MDRQSLTETTVTGEENGIPLGYCQCGCGEQTRIAERTRRARGWVKGTPLRYIDNHHSRHRRDLNSIYLAEDRGHDTPCWIFQNAGQTKCGYGLLWFNGATALAHRAFYELSRGKIPDGLELDHLCGVPRCINPDHLEAVTHTENMRRRYEELGA